MSWLLFMDESGHDHKNCPYEVRGGIAVESTRLWPLMQEVRAIHDLEFGSSPMARSRELKGAKLLSREKWRWSREGAPLSPDERRVLAARVLANEGPRTFGEFVAYGQACFAFTGALFSLLADAQVRFFAVAVPRGTPGGNPDGQPEYLRRDHVYLLERFAYFLEDLSMDGLLVFDEVEEAEDSRFLRRIERYFTATEKGRLRALRVSPVPFFVSSTMSLPVQVADIGLYCLNWGYRLPERGMDAETRLEIAEAFAPKLRSLVHSSLRTGYTSHSIAYVPNAR